MANKDIYIIGAGTYGEVMFELAEACGYKPIGFFDDAISKKGEFVMGIQVYGALEAFDKPIENKNFIVAIGNNKIRMEKMEQLLSLNANLPTLIHPSAEISPYAQISPTGCYIHANSYFWTKVKVHPFSIVSPNVMIAHHSTIDSGVFISACSNIGAGIHIKEKAFVGIGSTIMTGVKSIGENSIIGAGSVVIRNLDSGRTVVGNPAKELIK